MLSLRRLTKLTDKLSVFCNTEDTISVEQKSNVINQIHVLFVFKNILSNLIETSLPDLTSMAQKLTS